MSSGGQTIARNASVMMVSQIVTWALTFAVAIMVPRYIGPQAMGSIGVATAVWMIMMVFINFGMDLHLTKTVAREPNRAGELLGTSLIVRTVLFVISNAFVAIYVDVFKLDTQTIVVMVIIGIAVYFNSVTIGIQSVIMGFERMIFISITNIVSKAIITMGSIILILLGFGLYELVAVNVVSGIVSAALLYFFAHTRLALRLSWNVSDARKILFDSSQYLVTALAIVVYQQIDRLFIAALVDTRTVGWYITAMHLFGTLMFIPVVLGNVLLPSLTRSYANASDQYHNISRRSFDMMFMFSVPIGLGMSVIAKPLIELLFGAEFAPSAQILSLLGIVIIFTYLNTLLGQLLIATERTKGWNIVIIVAILVTLPLDLIFVPWTHATYGNGGLGGVIGFLITEFGMLVSAMLMLPKGTLQWSNVRFAVLTLICGGLMMAVCWTLRDQNMLLIILAGAVVYPASVLLLRVIRQEDMLLLRSLFMNVLARLRRSNPAASSSIGD